MSKVNKTNDQLSRREFLKRAAQATTAMAASAGLGSALAPLLVRAGEADSRRGSRISYFCNGQIHVNEVGKPEGKPLTTGHQDFKPSWSKTGNHLICFRRLKNDPITVNWKSAIFIINADGTGFHQLSDGIRYVLQDQRMHLLTIGMRLPGDIDANIRTLSGNPAYTDSDRALLAEFSAAAYERDPLKKMRID